MPGSACWRPAGTVASGKHGWSSNFIGHYPASPDPARGLTPSGEPRLPVILWPGNQMNDSAPDALQRLITAAGLGLWPSVARAAAASAAGLVFDAAAA